MQQRALAGEQYRGVFETFHRLIRGHSLRSSLTYSRSYRLTILSLRRTGPDREHPKPLLRGIARLYQGLGVSALRSVTTHGLLWTFFDLTASYIDSLPDPSRSEDRI